MSRSRGRWPELPAYLALPVGATALLCIGALAAALGGRLPAAAVAVLCGIVVLAMGAASEPTTVLPLGGIAWATAAAFARKPFGSLHPTAREAALSAAVMTVAAVAGMLTGWVGRSLSAPARSTLESVTGLAGFAAAVDRRRRISGAATAAVLLPLLTLVLTSVRAQVSLTDDLLIYLIAVVAVAVVGGFWPAVSAAIAASLLLNWFFTPPFHTFTIAEPDNLLALLLFIVVAVSVSSVVHVAARRAQQAARSRAESEALMQLARTVLGADDTPAAVLRHVSSSLGVGVQLLERSGDRWVRVAAAGDVDRPEAVRALVRADVLLVAHGEVPADRRRLLDAAGSQAAAALDRDRLRTQAAQAEALAAGNRMRTALLAAVSHDLRTPLASIKASISSLRQTDVSWTPEDEAALLANVEESADRLDALIANLLDMSRVQTGALQPYLQPASIDEIAPVALRSVAGARQVRLDVPEDLPLVLTDPGLLERALANLLSNAVRYSPPGSPAELVARDRADHVSISVIDHGPGVAPADRDRMFEPFQRLGDRDASTGVGLGLAVARGFVECVGGTVIAADTPGGGLTMTVRLPVARQRHVPHDAQAGR